MKKIISLTIVLILSARLSTAQYEISEQLAQEELSEVNFFLYTQKNPIFSQEVKKDDSRSLRLSEFNSSDDTYFYIHGWRGDEHNHWKLDKICEALLKNKSENKNVFYVDWSAYAHYNYSESRRKTKKVGEVIAKFLKFLNIAKDMQFDRVHLIGASLGAHVAGFAGKTTKQISNNLIRRIVALDAALPLFSYDEPNERLSSEDAYYVECVHTNGGVLGFFSAIGTADFYVNGGIRQPGCHDLLGFCSHRRAVSVYAEALEMGKNSNFSVRKCNNFDDLEESRCFVELDDIWLGSLENIKLARGMYNVITRVGS